MQIASDRLDAIQIPAPPTIGTSVIRRAVATTRGSLGMVLDERMPEWVMLGLSLFITGPIIAMMVAMMATSDCWQDLGTLQREWVGQEARFLGLRRSVGARVLAVRVEDGMAMAQLDLPQGPAWIPLSDCRR